MQRLLSCPVKCHCSIILPGTRGLVTTSWPVFPNGHPYTAWWYYKASARKATSWPSKGKYGSEIDSSPLIYSFTNIFWAPTLCQALCRAHRGQEGEFRMIPSPRDSQEERREAEHLCVIVSPQVPAHPYYTYMHTHTCLLPGWGGPTGDMQITDQFSVSVSQDGS